MVLFRNNIGKFLPYIPEKPDTQISQMLKIIHKNYHFFSLLQFVCYFNHADQAPTPVLIFLSNPAQDRFPRRLCIIVGAEKELLDKMQKD
jgi:hypothetical protein